MPELIVTANLPAPDDFYEALIDAHRDLTTAQSHAMNAALVLLLANHIGDLGVIRDALARAHQAARDTVPDQSGQSGQSGQSDQSGQTDQDQDQSNQSHRSDAPDGPAA